MIRQMVVAMLGRVDNDGRPAMGLVPIGMNNIRFWMVIRSAGVDSRGNGEHHTDTLSRATAVAWRKPN
jgi:hypothetical protein